MPSNIYQNGHFHHYIFIKTFFNVIFNTHTHTLTHSQTSTRTHSHTHSHTHSLTDTHSQARTNLHTHARTHTHTLTHIHARTHIHTGTHTRTHTHTHAHTHAHTHTLTHTHTLIFSIFRFFCILRFQFFKYCPNHTSMEILFIQMMHNSHDPYDWLCAAGSRVYKQSVCCLSGVRWRVTSAGIRPDSGGSLKRGRSAVKTSARRGPAPCFGSSTGTHVLSHQSISADVCQKHNLIMT